MSLVLTGPHTVSGCSYREFHELHQKLRQKFPKVEDLDFPGKRVITLFKNNAQFVEERRVALEAYLQVRTLAALTGTTPC